MNVGGTVGQDPKSVRWLQRNINRPELLWDGNPIGYPDHTYCSKSLTIPFTKDEIQKFVWPIAKDPDNMKGLTQLFYAVPGRFADVKNPTPREIDDWNVEVIRHFRRLLGITTPVWPNQRLFMEATWANEMGNTRVWDADYPPPPAIPPDPTPNCVGQGATHCGASFIPSLDHQIPYANGSGPVSTYVMSEEEPVSGRRTSRTEGIVWVITNLPWGTKMSRVISNIFHAESGMGAHMGPFIGRECVGFDFFVVDNKNSVFRGKWSGPGVNVSCL
jgi:hypothetical protein